MTKRIAPLALGSLGFGLLGVGALATSSHAEEPQSPPFSSPPTQTVPDVATLAAKVKPSVVNITTTHAVRAPAFELPFGPFGGQGGVLKQRSLGSGVIFDTHGHVVTNAHVADGADTVRVKLSDDREFDAKVKGKDTLLDLAVLEIQGANNLPAASLGSSENTRVGEYAVAIGNPFGLGNTVTMGIVSAKGRAIGAGPYDDFIQTDASINPGNSGGPLFNMNGQVIGINTAMASQGQGIGFAIPIDAVKAVLPQLLTKGHVERGHIGVLVQPVDEDLARAMGLDQPRGALVAQLDKNGPAARAGVKEGDLIVDADGVAIVHENDLPREIARHAPGSKVTLGVMRDGKRRTVEVTLDALKEQRDEQQEVGRPEAPAPSGSLGVYARDAEGGGAVIERIDPEAPAAQTLQRGDVIVEVDNKPVSSARDLSQRLKDAPKDRPLLLKIERQGQTRYVGVSRK